MKAPVDNKFVSVKFFVVEQYSAWGTITPLKPKDGEKRQQEEDQRMSPPLQFWQPNHRAEMEEVERRMREKQALVADIKSKRQTDDDKTG